MRLAAVLVLSLATVAALAVTSLGASPGHNKFFIVTELLILAAAVGGVVATVASPRVKLVGAAIGLPAVCLLSLLLLPLLHSQRADVLAPLLPGQERGFVLAALGRPDLVSDGIGIARSSSSRASALPVPVARTGGLETQRLRAIQISSAGQRRAHSAVT